MTWRDRLGPVGMWRNVQRVDVELARTVEGLGLGTVWQGSSPSADLRAAEALLDGTSSIVVATGIVNIWSADPVELADAYARISAKHPARLLLGIGTGHREATPERVRPLDAMARYLDVLDERGVPQQARVLSALGPKMLALAAERSAGTHPYLTVPAQTAEARAALGPDALVAPELTVVLDSDAESARSTARAFLANYLRMSNYTGNMRRAGFSDEDLGMGGSDTLVDRIVAHGDADEIAAAIAAHLEAGADHVCVQVLPAAASPVGALAAVADRLRDGSVLG